METKKDSNRIIQYLSYLWDIDRLVVILIVCSFLFYVILLIPAEKISVKWLEETISCFQDAISENPIYILTAVLGIFVRIAWKHISKLEEINPTTLFIDKIT